MHFKKPVLSCFFSEKQNSAYFRKIQVDNSYVFIVFYNIKLKTVSSDKIWKLEPGINPPKEERNLHWSCRDTFRHRGRHEMKHREPGIGRTVDINKSLLLAARKDLQLSEDALNPDLNLLHFFPHVSWLCSFGFLWDVVPCWWLSSFYPCSFWWKKSITWTNVMEIINCNHNNAIVYFFCCQLLLWKWCHIFIQNSGIF